MSRPLTLCMAATPSSIELLGSNRRGLPFEMPSITRLRDADPRVAYFNFISHYEPDEIFIMPSVHSHATIANRLMFDIARIMGPCPTRLVMLGEVLQMLDMVPGVLEHNEKRSLVRRLFIARFLARRADVQFGTPIGDIAPAVVNEPVVTTITRHPQRPAIGAHRYGLPPLDVTIN